MVESLIDAEVVYAAIDRQRLLAFTVAQGTSVRAALLASGIGNEFPELLIWTSVPVGTFGKQVADPQNQVLQAGERIEIYRPLLADPKKYAANVAATAEAKRQSQV